jgi:hypothetical protein
MACGWVALALAFGGCAVPGGSMRHEARPAALQAKDATPAKSLQGELIALKPSVSADEAWEIASEACEKSRQLASDYRVVRPAIFHNFLVNTGFKKRGLCYHWAGDLIAHLQSMDLVTVQVHWAIARAGTVREHNAVVITAAGQPFEEGIVLDAWRRSGDLFWIRVEADRYPWEEGELDGAPTP